MSSIGSAFFKWLPLRILPAELIPASLDQLLMAEITDRDLAYLGSLMANLCVLKNGVGLSALQVGIPIPFFVASTDQKDFTYYYEASYEGLDIQTSSIEGCLSILDKIGKPRRFLLSRYKKIICKGKKFVPTSDNPQFQLIEEEHDGLVSIVLQHEIDHHNFKLISDLGKEVQII